MKKSNLFKNRELNFKLLSLSLVIYILIILEIVIFKGGRYVSILGTKYTLNPMGFGPVTESYMHLSLYERFIFDFGLRPDDPLTLLVDFILNSLIFLPLGLLLPLFFKRNKLLKVALITFLMSLSMELFQLFTAFGAFSVTDLAFNTIGSILGALLNLLLIKYINKDYLAGIINLVALIAIIITLPLSIYFIVNIILHFDGIIYRFTFRA